MGRIPGRTRIAACARSLPCSCPHPYRTLKPPRYQQARRDEALDDAGQWLQRIDALLQAGAARIGLLVRDYDGAVSDRQPKPPERHWPRGQLAAADLLAFEPGTLHWIERG